MHRPSPHLCRRLSEREICYFVRSDAKECRSNATAGDIKTQTANVIEAIKASLVTFDLDLGAVIRCAVWLSDIRLMKEFNDVYAHHFGPALPVRSTVEAKLSQGVDVEIEVTAWCGR